MNLNSNKIIHLPNDKWNSGCLHKCIAHWHVYMKPSSGITKGHSAFTCPYSKKKKSLSLMQQLFKASTLVNNPPVYAKHASLPWICMSVFLLILLAPGCNYLSFFAIWAWHAPWFYFFRIHAVPSGMTWTDSAFLLNLCFIMSMIITFSDETEWLPGIISGFQPFLASLSHAFCHKSMLPLNE